jgi:hypothetical protein
LVVLVADLDMENALISLLSRPQSLETRPFTFDCYRHPGKDPGVYQGCVNYLRQFFQTYHYALVLFDYQGCGREETPKQVVEEQLKASLARNGWTDRAEVIVLEPELEAWVWSQSPHVAEVLGWGASDDLRAFLIEKNWLNEGDVKPQKPKEAMEAALRWVKKPRSAHYFKELGEKASLRGCQDPSFNQLLTVLRQWFPPTDQLG